MAGSEARMWFGGCPNIPLVENFDAERFAGKWYEIERDAIFPMEMGQECVTHNYKYVGNNSLDLYFHANAWIMGGEMGIGGNMDCSAASANGNTCMTKMYPEDPSKQKDTRSPIDIIATDYENWQVMYVCGEMLWGAGFMQWVLINSRQPTLSPEHLAQAYAAIENALPGFALGWPWMHYTQQGDNCSYDWSRPE